MPFCSSVHCNNKQRMISMFRHISFPSSYQPIEYPPSHVRVPMHPGYALSPIQATALPTPHATISTLQDGSILGTSPYLCGIFHMIESPSAPKSMPPNTYWSTAHIDFNPTQLAALVLLVNQRRSFAKPHMHAPLHNTMHLHMCMQLMLLLFNSLENIPEKKEIIFFSL